MFGPIGGQEILFVLLLAFLIFGPRKLPQIGRSLGRALAELRRATQEFRSGLEREIELEELREGRRAVEEAGRALRDPAAVAQGRAPQDSAPENREA